MEVFKNEGNVSQDANFRAHLDDNWDSGNREFDKVEAQLEIALDDIQFLKNEIPDCKKELENLKQQHSSDIDALNKVIAAQDKLNKNYDQRLQRLEAAIFDYGAYEVNYETPHHDSSVTEINVDSNPLLKGE